ncbi:ATP dependent regulatory protein [Enhygromyxa salina]|uniref:ATP dependent regulatory protein n=2 Tax=Enhygromyxa salina TaxID=215803 RepID=A0A0C2DAW8_9BACT|nr:ATP dependent regulatory protein [Enhygromyxa salina]
MASVEAAIDRTLGRRVAIKLMLEEHQRAMLAVRSFIREAQITGQLDHPNIVPVHELGVDASGRLFFTMKLVEGRTLLQLIDELRANQDRYDRRGFKVSTTVEHDELLRLIDVFLKVLDAVAFAHSRGVAHCDIKAENVMVGDYGQVYLMDWGISKVLPEREVAAPFVRPTRVRNTLPPGADRANLVIGTPAYMSPEQARGEQREVDHRTDVFALGAMLFEILTGHPPYQGHDAAEELEQAKACKPVLLPHLPIVRELRRIVGVAMHADPAQRYQSVELFRADLQGFMRGGDNFPRRRFAKGEWLIREGEEGDAAFILISGRCEVFKQVNAKQESLRMLGAGDVFGETAILASSPRTASVVALTEVVAMIVTADVLEREVDAMKPWMGSFIGALARRFSDVEDRALKSSASGRGNAVEIANHALMTLETWGQPDAELGKSMSVLSLCKSIAGVHGISEDAVLKVLRQYSQFEIVLTLDVISLRDQRGLIEELGRFVRY